jgi:hypothetical protein
MASAIYNKHPEKDCIHAISMHPADGLERRGGAAPFPAEDETTVLGGGLKCHRRSAEDTREEERAHAHRRFAASSIAWPSLWPQSCQQQVTDAEESPQRAESPETPRGSRS